MKLGFEEREKLRLTKVKTEQSRWAKAQGKSVEVGPMKGWAEANIRCGLAAAGNVHVSSLTILATTPPSAFVLFLLMRKQKPGDVTLRTQLYTVGRWQNQCVPLPSDAKCRN